MNALMPKSWHRLPESEKKKIEEIKEAEIERRMLVIVDIILKMSCESLNETEHMGEGRLSCYLGNFHRIFRQHAKLVKEGKQMDYLDEKMRKIFRKGGYPDYLFKNIFDGWGIDTNGTGGKK